jgi:hypothetical protein
MALACALLAGCGGEERAPAPKLPAGLAQSLAARSERVAEKLEADDACGARAEAEALQAETIAAVNERRIPRRFQEELLGSVTALAESIECVRPPATDEPDEVAEDEDATDDGEEDDDEDEGEGRGKGKGKGESKGKGDGKKKGKRK